MEEEHILTEGHADALDACQYKRQCEHVKGEATEKPTVLARAVMSFTKESRSSRQMYWTFLCASILPIFCNGYTA